RAGGRGGMRRGVEAQAQVVGVHGAEGRIRGRVRDWALVDLGSLRDTRRHGEGLDAEAADERSIGAAATIAVQVSLVPGDAKWPIGNLNHKQIEVCVRWQMARRNLHDLDRALRLDSDLGLRTLEAAGAANIQLPLSGAD